jgi:hypothetical protein
MTAGPTPASHTMNWPSRKFSGLPESQTNGIIKIAGKGGKLMNHLPSKSAKSFMPLYEGGVPSK